MITRQPLGIKVYTHGEMLPAHCEKPPHARTHARTHTHTHTPAAMVIDAGGGASRVVFLSLLL